MKYTTWQHNHKLLTVSKQRFQLLTLIHALYGLYVRVYARWASLRKLRSSMLQHQKCMVTITSQCQKIKDRTKAFLSTKNLNSDQSPRTLSLKSQPIILAATSHASTTYKSLQRSPSTMSRLCVENNSSLKKLSNTLSANFSNFNQI